MDLRPGLDLLVRVDPHSGHHARLGADRDLVADRRVLVDPDVVADVARAADDRPLDQRRAADVRRGVDDRAHDARALAQGDAVRQHGVRADRGVAGDPAVVADERGALDLLDVVDVDAFADPDVAAQQDARDVQAHALLERVEVRLPELVDRADVLPVAVEHVAVERPAHLEQEREELLREVVRPVGGHVPQHLGLEHVDPGVDRVGEDLAPRRLLQEPLDPPVVVGDDDPELERVRHGLEPDRHVCALLLVGGDERGQVDVAEGVAGDDEKGVVERVAREADRAGSAERLLLDRVLDLEAHRLAGAEVAADRLRHERERDDDFLHPVQLQQLEDVLHAGLADDRHHRLRLIRRQRPEPGPLATGHHDRLHVPTSRRALSTYCAAATSASATPIQKSQTGQSTPLSVTITKPIDA